MSRGLLVAAALACAIFLPQSLAAQAQDDVPGGVEILLPAGTVVETPAAPDLSLPPTPPSAMWRSLKAGRSGSSHPSDPQDGVLIRTDAEQWRFLAAGPLRIAGAWALLLLFVALLALHVARGREPAPEWESGREVQRFSRPQRLSHWLAAVSFLVLSLTGLNLMYGSAVVAPLTGTEAFAAIALVGRYLHAAAGVVFAVGLVFVGVLWLGERSKGPKDRQLPIVDGVMRPPPRAKYTLGQQLGLAFFLVAGLVMIVSGACLLFLLSYRGPVPIQTVQLTHSSVGLIMIIVAVIHSYRTAIAREQGAVAIVRGTVSEEWANRHFRRWLAAAAPTGASDDQPGSERGTGDLRAAASDRTPESAT